MRSLLLYLKTSSLSLPTENQAENESKSCGSKAKLGDIKWSQAYLDRVESTAEAILDIKVASGAKMVCVYNIPSTDNEMDIDLRDLWMHELTKAGVVNHTISGDLTPARP